MPTTRVMTHPPGVWAVDVGWTDVRPIRIGQHVTRVHVSAQDEWEAQLVAAQMVRAIGPQCEMPTSTRIVEVVF